MGIKTFFKRLFKDSPIKGVGEDITTTGDRTHTVVKGETLSAISLRYYGDANQYMRIYNANSSLLKNPDKIYPGQVLSIPN